jgi:hypothetical protein
VKERLSVYLDPQVMRSLIDYADRRGKSKSLIAEAAIFSFLSPDAAERQEATFARRLDRLLRQMERLDRDVGISAEALALFVRFWLLVLLTAIWPSVWTFRRVREHRRLKAGRCLSCGYDVRASPGRCPECGTSVIVAGAA